MLDGWDLILLQGRVPAAHGDFTCAVDVNLRWNNITDIIVFDQSIEHVQTAMISPTDDIYCEELDLADIRARLAKILKLESMMPTRGPEGWHPNSAFLQWLIRSLPEGGSDRPRRELDEAEIGALRRDFLASPTGVMFGRWHGELVNSLLAFGIDSGSGDPTRWNRRRAEEWLFDELLDGDGSGPGDSEAAPYLLRAFILFAHEWVGIRPDLTAGVLSSIHMREASFYEKLRHLQNVDDIEYPDVG